MKYAELWKKLAVCCAIMLGGYVFVLCLYGECAAGPFGLGAALMNLVACITKPNERTEAE